MTLLHIVVHLNYKRLTKLERQVIKMKTYHVITKLGDAVYHKNYEANNVEEVKTQLPKNKGYKSQIKIEIYEWKKTILIN